MRYKFQVLVPADGLFLGWSQLVFTVVLRRLFVEFKAAESSGLASDLSGGLCLERLEFT